MSSEKGRFSCYIDLTKSEKAAQAYFFLKSLGNLRQDIIIDMVLRTLGDDIFLDFEHMSRAEAMAVYNENVYAKRGTSSSSAAGFRHQTMQQTVSAPKPAESAFPETVPAAITPVPDQDESAGHTGTETFSEGSGAEHVGPAYPEHAENTEPASSAPRSHAAVSEIEEEKPFRLDEDTAAKTKPVGLRQISAARHMQETQQTQKMPSLVSYEDRDRENASTAQNDADDLDSLPDEDASFVAGMISDSFQDG